MAASANDIINDAVLMGGIGDIYNPLDGQNVQFALRMLNGIIDSWSTEELTVYDIVEGTFNFTAGTNYYTNGAVGGTGLNFRPPFIDSVTVVDANTVTYKVQIIGVGQWSDIIYKPAPGRPEVVYFDGNFPLLGSYWWPTPAFSSDVAHIWYGNPVPAFTTLGQQLTAPPGFELFMKLQLACTLGPAYGIEPSPQLKGDLWSARNNARNLNNQPKILHSDVPVNRRKAFNIYYGY
jgi:hypothetical protein